MRITLILAAAAMWLGCGTRAGNELNVAVASNFADAATRLADRFEQQTGVGVTLSFGSTGKHYAQIRNGAPYDVFLAADVERPTMLEREGAAVPGSSFTYARGKLVLWSPTPGYVDTEGEVLSSGTFRFLAIANPELAPYGRAARQVLERRGLWDDLAERIVRGENVTQSFQFVESGNAELGFAAYSQLKNITGDVSIWLVPDSLHAPIDQAAVLVREGDPARAFLKFLASSEGKELIQSSGYDTP